MNGLTLQTPVKRLEKWLVHCLIYTMCVIDSCTSQHVFLNDFMIVLYCFAVSKSPCRLYHRFAMVLEQTDYYHQLYKPILQLFASIYHL
jgi:hypothetical protein